MNLNSKTTNLNHQSNFIVFLFIILLSYNGKAQFWQEDFGIGCSQGTIADGFVSPQGIWTVSNIGTNGAHAHQWFISARSFYNPNQAFPQCDSICDATVPNKQLTLHIAPSAFTGAIPGGPTVSIDDDSAAVVITGGLCAGGAGYCVETSKRAESPEINCTGRQNITLRFDYFEGGTAPAQECFLAYFDGVSWNNTFFNLSKSNGACATGQWTDILVPLPASADNNPDVKIGFFWENNDPAVPTGGPLTIPSFSVSHIRVFGNILNLPLTVGFNVTGNRNICVGSQVTFNSTSTGADSLVWNFPGGTPNSSNAVNPVVTYNAIGSFPVSLAAYNTTTGNFVDTSAFNFIVVDSCNSLPTANFAPQDTTICIGDSIQFRDLSTGGANNWAWFFPGGSNITFDSNRVPRPVVYNNAGVYEVTLIAQNTGGLDDTTVSAAVTVQECFLPIPRFSVVKDSICKGECVNIIDESRFGTTYQWFFNGADSATQFSTQKNPRVCYDSTGLFDVTLLLSNTYGDVSRTEVAFISVADTPILNAGIDQEILAGEVFLMQPRGTGQRYFWLEEGENPNNLNDPSTLSCRRCETPVVNPNENQTYVVFNINNHGCFTTDTITISVINEYYIGVPTAFSPNLDGENDELYVLGNGFFSLEFSIYNRFGQKIFETTDRFKGWDGRFNGELLNPGTFVYVVKVVFLNGVEEVISGNVTLIR